MAEEPQPGDGAPPGPPSGQKAAESAALSNLSDAVPEPGSSTATDTAALGAALSNLSVADGKTPAAATAEQPKAADTPAKKIKIDQADVSFLTANLDVTKIKATSMLRAAEGSRQRALEDYVLPKSLRAHA